MPPPELDPVRWFAREVHPHESSLRAYLRGAFPTVRDVDDVVQESYLRTWRARAVQPVRSAKAFLFRVARHVALDLVRRERRGPFEAVGDVEELQVADTQSDAPTSVETQEKIRLLADAIESLPRRCREVVILRKIQMRSQKEVAAHLGLAEKTIEAQLSRGLDRCEEFLRSRGVRGWYDHE